MQSESDLKAQAREAIESGRVPANRPERLWGSSGDGSDCPICCRAIESQDVGFELDFPAASAREPSRPSCMVHARCFKAWDVVRLEAAKRPPPPTGKSAAAP
jgi:hypothetical protein